MRRTMVLGTVLAAACGVEEGTIDAFRDAAPSRQALTVAFPGAGDASSDASHYRLAADAARHVNADLADLAALVEAVILQEPALVDDDRAEWGPATAEGAADTWRFSIERVGLAFDWRLEGRAKKDPDEAFVTIAGGRSEPRGARAGSGQFLVDWDAGADLAAPPVHAGRAEFRWERSASGKLTIESSVTDGRDAASAEPLDMEASFVEEPGEEGALELTQQKDLGNDGSARETLELAARWLPAGPGRGHLRLSGGDLRFAIASDECWDATFARTWYADDVGWTPAEGAESTCALRSAR